MRIADRKAGHTVFFFSDTYRIIYHALNVNTCRQRFCFKINLSHVYGHSSDKTVDRVKVQFSYSACRFYGQIVSLYIAFVMQQLSDTADAVSCHLAFGAVAVEYTHFSIGDRRAFNKHNAVSAYSFVPVAKAYAE